jgi:hypothetical protein
MIKTMISRRPHIGVRGLADSRRIGNLWPEAIKPGEQPVPIRDMDALAAHCMTEGEARYASLLQESFDAHCDEFPQFDQIVNQLRHAGVSCVVIGGWARDIIVGRKPHDVDLVVVGADTNTLERMLPATSRRTALGGFSFEYEGIEIDLWSLEDTHLIRHLGLQPSLQTLMQVIDFNVNAILFTPAQFARKPRLLDGGMSESLGTREIDFNCGVLPLPIAQVSRLAYISAKLGFALSPRVRLFMHEQCIVRGLQPKVEANLAQYCPEELRQQTLDTLHAAVSTLS